MKIIGKLHYDNCEDTINSLHVVIKQLQDQNIGYMRELNEVVCKLRLATLELPEKKCADCQSNSDIDIKIDTVVE
jgi:hypothetical protein